MKTNYREKHEFEDDNQPHDFRGMGLCMCGLPEDNPLHLTPKQTTGENTEYLVIENEIMIRLSVYFHECAIMRMEPSIVTFYEKIKPILEHDRTHLLDELEEKLSGMNIDIQKLVNPINSGAGNQYPDMVDVGAQAMAQQAEGYNKSLFDILTLVSKMRNKV